MLYLCPFPKNINPQDPEVVKAEIRKNAEIFGNALGISIVLSEIRYGYRIDITASNSEGELHLKGVQRFTIQIEKTSKGLFVMLMMELPGGLAMLEMMTVERDSEIAKMTNELVERVVGAQSGRCALI